MDLSVKKENSSLSEALPQASSKPMEVIKSESKKSLSFSVERLLKSSKNEETNRSEASAQIVSSAASIITTPCLATAALPIRPLVTHPNPSSTTGSLSLLQSFYVPAMYSHQVLVRPPDLFGPASAASFLSLPAGSHHVHHHLNPMGNGKRKKSWTRAVFSHLQRKGLEKRFQMQKYITKPDRRQLAASLGLTDAQVKVWFQNRRMKWRHMESKERREQEKQAQAAQASVGSSRPVGPTSVNSPIAQGANSAASSSVSVAAPSNFPPFLHPIHNHSAAHLSAAAAAAASTNSSFFYEDDEDDDDEDDEDDDDDEDAPRLVMNADSTGDPEDIKVD